jgi:hypothetical protein
MAQTESQVVALELERVFPKVSTLFDREGLFYAALEKRPVEIVSNRDMRVPLELRPGGNPGHFNPDGGDLGRGDAPTYEYATIAPVFTKYACEVTTLSQWATDDRRKAVLNSFRQTLAKSMAEYRRFIDSLCMTAGNGVLGTITSITTADGVDTYTCGTISPTAPATYQDGFGVRLLRYGQTVNIYDNGLDTLRTPGEVNGTGQPTKISYYDLVNKQISIPSVTGVSVGDKIVSQGLSATPPVSLLGVPYHDSNASSGSWMGFDRATTPEIRANRVSGNNAFLTLPLPRLAINKIGDRVGMDNIGRLQAWMHPCQVQAYEQLGFLVTQLNQTGEGKGLDLYFGGAMQMAGCPVKKSYSWDKTRIDFVGLDVWGRGVIQEAGFYKPEGVDKYIFEVRGASGGVATSNIFYIAAGFNIFMNNPAGAAYIDTLKIPSGY